MRSEIATPHSVPLSQRNVNEEMKKRINIAAIVDKMQTAVQHLASLCPRNRFFTLLLAVANSSLFTLHSSLFISCSTDEASEAPAVQYEMPVAVSASAMLYEEGAEEQRAARRTEWTPPTGYYLYEQLYQGENYVNLPNLSQSVIDLFMTHDNAEGDANTGVDKLHTRLRHSPSATTTSQWKLSLPNITLPGPPERKLTEDDVKQGNYYAYGFVPRDAAEDASLEKLRPNDATYTWAEGAVLTIQGLQSVATDPCVIIGANHGPNDHDDGGLTAGNFQFYLNRTAGNPPTNYLYFLFDHLYSAFSISMRVNGDYHVLRHIKLKRIYLRTETTTGVTPSKTNVTITLKSNSGGNNPISGDIFYETSDNTPTDRLIYSNSEGYPLTDNYSMFLGHFMPNSVSKLILTSVYDVYDTEGNLIRKDCSATNTMHLSDLFSGQTVSARGWKYKVWLTINPTYLYVMSNPDLNNPTVTVDN